MFLKQFMDLIVFKRKFIPFEIVTPILNLYSVIAENQQSSKSEKR